MGYIHIESLYKLPIFFKQFKEVFAMEKIHGTSSWITFETNHDLNYHSGAETTDNFKALFDDKHLQDNLMKISIENNWNKIKIHGEAYGGKQQGMSETYGNKLKFIVFDIFVVDNNEEIQDKFLNIPEAEKIAIELGLEFVYYKKIKNTPELIEEEAEKESIQAIRNGKGIGKSKEGIVIRPIDETYILGKRAIAKYKNKEFWEIKSRRPLGEVLKILENQDEIINEWLTEMRFQHVLDRVLQMKEKKEFEKKDIKIVIDLMVEDIFRESQGEIIWSNDIEKAIKRKTGIMFKNNAKYLELK